MIEKKKKVGIYCRLSEEDKNKGFETDDSNSIQNQKSMLIQYCIENDWEIYGIYSDDDYTGADRSRPEFNKLLNDAKNNKFDIILCKTQSRFTRELELVEKYIHGLFPIWGIRFISIVDNADTANKGNKKSRQINGLVNEWYLEDMSENIKSVLNDRRKNGYHIGSFALYGYKKDPELKGHLIIDDEAANIVKEVFTLFSKGYGKTAIARMLNDRGIPNPTEYKRLKGLGYKQPKTSTLWKYFSISNMLTNEIYIGNMVQGKYGSVSYKSKKNKPRPREQWYIVEGTHEPIIDRELWDRVQALIAQKARPYTSGEIGLFATKARCMHCGHTMCSNKQSGGRRYLQCASRNVSKDACIGSFISVCKLEQVIINELAKLCGEYLDRHELNQNIIINSNLSKEKEAVKEKIAIYQKKLGEYKKILYELYLDKIKGIIFESDFIELSKELYAEKERMEKALMDEQKALKNINMKTHFGDDKSKLIDEYVNPKSLDRDMVETLIDFILIGKKDAETKIAPIEIHWKF